MTPPACSTVYPAGLYDYADVAEGVATLDDITDGHLAFLREQGYLVVNRVLSPAVVAEVQAAITDMIQGRNPQFNAYDWETGADPNAPPPTLEQREAKVRKLMWFCEFDERFKLVRDHEKVINLLGRIYGEPPAILQEMALLKPPGGREKPWHQDCAYFDYDPATTPVLGFWYALDEATPENGCMRVWPGGHRQGPIIHFRRRDWQICDSDMAAAPRRAVCVPLKPGGCLIFNGLLPHGTPVNHSSRGRRAMQMHYIPASARNTSQEQRLAIFGSEGKNVEC